MSKRQLILVAVLLAGVVGCRGGSGSAPSGLSTTGIGKEGKVPTSQTPAVSPEGKIAFISGRDGNLEIYTMDADGTNQTRLTNNPGIHMQPSWSPDGGKITFHSLREPYGNQGIYVMNADGSSQVRLSEGTGGDGFPCWSPDGSKIAFESDRNGNDEIYIMDSDGTNQTDLTNDSAGDGSPSWGAF